MKKKNIIQISLVILGLVLLFNTYYSNDKDKVVEEIDKNILKEDFSNVTEDTVNMIKDANYSGESGGTFYELNADIAEIKSDDQNISHLQGVTAVIKLGDLRTINIRSDKAVFDKTSNDTKFFGNVLVTEKDNIITCNNLDLLMSESTLSAYNFVKYKNSKNSYVLADKVDIDMITKKANIFMYKKDDKVRIKYIN
jgi:hypothetical protein